MKIEKSDVNIGWWRASATVKGIYFVKGGKNKLVALAELFDQIRWTLNLN